METGQYFLKQHEKKAIQLQEKREKKVAKTVLREQKYRKLYTPPAEDSFQKIQQQRQQQQTVQKEEGFKASVEKIKSQGQKRKKDHDSTSIDDYVVKKKRKVSTEELK